VASVLVRLRECVDRVIVCDDGSVDLTGEIAEAMGAVVVRHPRNMGYGCFYALLVYSSIMISITIHL